LPTAPPSTAAWAAAASSRAKRRSTPASSPTRRRVVLDRPVDVRRSGSDSISADRIEEDELVAGVEAHVAPHVDVQRRSAVVRVDGNLPARAEYRQVELGIRTRSDLDDQIDAVRCDLLDAIRRVRLLCS
jgi:hypothetical protein